MRIRNRIGVPALIIRTQRIVMISFVLAFAFLSYSGTANTTQAQIPEHVWSQDFGGPAHQFALGVAVDDSGSVLVTGFFEDRVNFGGVQLTSAGGTDIFVAKFDADGGHNWSKRFGDASDQNGQRVAVDDLANVVVAGDFEGAVDFGGGALASAGNSDLYITKFDRDGNHIWSERFGGAKNESMECVAVDDSGNVYVTGFFQDSVDFGGGTLVSAGWWDIYIAKFDADGNHIWSDGFGDGLLETGQSVAVDGSGNVLLTGQFEGTLNLGGEMLASAGGFDIFVAKFDSGGNHIWSRRFGDAFPQSGLDVASDGLGNIWLTGDFWGTVDFGGGPLTDAGMGDIYLAKFDSGGNHLWSNRFGDASIQRGNRLEVDGSGNVFVEGEFEGTVDFGGGPLTSAGSWDIFVAKFDSEGGHVWSEGYGGVNNQYGRSFALNNSGNIVLAGAFEGTMDFGGGTLASAGLYDVYLAKFSQTVPIQLRHFTAAPAETGIKISWILAEAGTSVEFFVSRAQATGTLFRQLHDAHIEQDGLSFTFVDETCKPGVTYRYRVGVADEGGPRVLFETEAVTLPVLSLTLDQNHPNPFNPSTTISFVLPRKAHTNLSVFGVDGKLVKCLVNYVTDDGYGEVTWDGKDACGNPVSSGVYFYRLKAGKKVLTKKMVLLK